MVHRRDSARDSQHRRRRRERLSTVNRSSRIRGRLWSRRHRTLSDIGVLILDHEWSNGGHGGCTLRIPETGGCRRYSKARARIVKISGSAIHIRPRTPDGMPSRQSLEHPSPRDPVPIGQTYGSHGGDRFPATINTQDLRTTTAASAMRDQQIQTCGIIAHRQLSTVTTYRSATYSLGVTHCRTSCSIASCMRLEREQCKRST